jgi:RNA-directed DNA polymerase
MLAALGNGVTGGKWYSLMDKVSRIEVLEAAWERVAANHGAAGVDRQSVEAFAAHRERYLAELSEALAAGRYVAQPVRRTYIPKRSGGQRPLGIPTVKDRVVQGALKLVLEPIFEREFVAGSYGFRPGRGCKDALRDVEGLLKAGHVWVVDADIRSYFEAIPKDALLGRVGEKVSDGRVLSLVEGFLNQDILEGLERWTPLSGTPQGAVLSPLLANVYLHPLDRAMGEAGHRMVRYADDFVVLCRSEAEAQAALERVRRWVAANGLALHPDKTHVGNCLERGQGFEFLGYRFEAGRRYVRTSSRRALKERVRQLTRRSGGQSLERVIAGLNPLLRGWFAYFKHAHRTEFPALDGFIRRRLRALLRKQAKRPGAGHCAADHRRWPNAFFAEHGLFTLLTAHDLARQSR